MNQDVLEEKIGRIMKKEALLDELSYLRSRYFTNPFDIKRVEKLLKELKANKEI